MGEIVDKLKIAGYVTSTDPSDSIEQALDIHSGGFGGLNCFKASIDLASLIDNIKLTKPGEREWVDDHNLISFFWIDDPDNFRNDYLIVPGYCISTDENVMDVCLIADDGTWDVDAVISNSATFNFDKYVWLEVSVEIDDETGDSNIVYEISGGPENILSKYGDSIVSGLASMPTDTMRQFIYWLNEGPIYYQQEI